MKKLREVYRLKFELKYSNRQIARSVNISAGTVSEYLSLLKVTGLSWEEVVHYDDEVLEKAVYRHSPTTQATRFYPDWDQIHIELKRKGVTLLLLWHEYKEQYPAGLGYTQFTKLYRRYAKTLDPVMRFNHKSGEKTFVDYAGLTMEWISPSTGEIHKGQIFVGCLGGSSLIFVEATESQSLADWIGSHIRMFEFFGGVSEILVPDNLKSGITKAHRYDPDINSTYHELALHYDIAVIPTRVVSPRDKAKVENAVLCVERQIIAPLRHHTFTSLDEINQAIKPKLEALNNKPMQRINISRRELFEQCEKSNLKPLPNYRFELQEWKQAKVHIDYHICVNKHFYSVPFRLIGERLDVCITQSRIEVFQNSKRITVHQRSNNPNQFTTLEEHMPPKHRFYFQEKDTSIEWIKNWSKKMGSATEACVEKLFQLRSFPQQAIRAVLGLKRLSERYGMEKFNQACQKALELHRLNYKTIDEILKHDLYKTNKTVVISNNKSFRGADYYK